MALNCILETFCMFSLLSLSRAFISALIINSHAIANRTGIVLRNARSTLFLAPVTWSLSMPPTELASCFDSSLISYDLAVILTPLAHLILYHMIYHSPHHTPFLGTRRGCTKPGSKISHLWKHCRVLNDCTDRWSLLVNPIASGKLRLIKSYGRNYHCMMRHTVDGIHAVDTL